jgi:hypothetical protein
VTPARRAARTPARPSRTSIWYVYGIVPATVSPSSAPAGIGGEPVVTVGRGDVAALATELDAEAYTPFAIEAGVGDVAWIAPRAQAHNDVVSWASQPGPVVPLHMWTLFSDRDAVEEMLERRSSTLSGLLKELRDVDEYGLRVFADAAALAKSATATGAEAAELERQALESGPGQRYLIERKLERTRRDAARVFARRVADDVYETLAEQSVKAAHDTIPASSGAEAGAVVSAAFLVRRKKLAAFQRALADLSREHEAAGFRFDLTGPWPPYHFVGEDQR